MVVASCSPYRFMLTFVVVVVVTFSSQKMVRIEAFRLINPCSHPSRNDVSQPFHRHRHQSLGSNLFSNPPLSSSLDKSKETMDRRVARRWNGNYKHSSTKLCDVSKAKKLQLELSVPHADGSIVTKTLVKKRQETLQHVLTKAILWKLFCDEYPGIEIERDIGDPDYLPDVISLDEDGNPLFWGESGRMKIHKAIDLMRRYPNSHIVHCRWDMDIDAIAAPLLEHLQELFDTDCLGDLPTRSGRFTFCSLPLDVWRFIDEENGMIHVSSEDLVWKELRFPTSKTLDVPVLGVIQ